MRESNQKYDCKYPWSLPPEKTLWVLKEGDVLTDGEKDFKVTYCYYSPIPNKPPTIELKEILNGSQKKHD